MSKKKTVLDEDRLPVESNDKNVTADSEKERKTAPQDRTAFESNDHVQYHLDVDPNDPRNREPAPKLPSLDDEGQS